MKVRDAPATSRVLVVAIMVSMVAFLDSNVVNLALPAQNATWVEACRCNSGSSAAICWPW